MPRLMDVILCGLGLLVLSPLLVLLAIIIRISSPGPILFRQIRVGRHGRHFELLKFRSMVDHPTGAGTQVTASGDRRITLFGRMLRGAKLDELPQLWNVIRGDMALVGPRPEVPCYVDLQPELFALVLQQRPGITGVCTLHLRNEEQILATADDPERYYLETLLPRKLAASVREGWRKSIWRDLRVIIATLLPPLHGLAPLPDFRPLAHLYTLPEARRELAAATEAGGTPRAVEPSLEAPVEAGQLGRVAGSSLGS